MNQPLLVAERITVFYGQSQALFDANLEVAEGEVVALMGRNGMGKSTLLKAICKMLPFRDGSIRFSGKELQNVPSHAAARLGIGICPEGRRCFRTLTVNENLMAAARPGYWDFPRIRHLFPRLGERDRQVASTLSGGEQQMLAIGRALMTNPRLLLLDEATEGLAPMVRREIWKAIGQLKQETGMSILLVDKSLGEVSAVADKCVFLERGRDVWSGPPALASADLAIRYLGV